MSEASAPPGKTLVSEGLALGLSDGPGDLDDAVVKFRAALEAGLEGEEAIQCKGLLGVALINQGARAGEAEAATSVGLHQQRRMSEGADLVEESLQLDRAASGVVYAGSNNRVMILVRGVDLAWCLHADFLEKSKGKDEAIAYLLGKTSLTDLVPGYSPQLWLKLGWLYYETSQKEKARDAWQRAVDSDFAKYEYYGSPDGAASMARSNLESLQRKEHQVKTGCLVLVAWLGLAAAVTAMML